MGVDTGQYGTPTYIAPNPSSACSMLFSDRIASGRRSTLAPASSSALPDAADGTERLAIGDDAPVAAGAVGVLHAAGEEGRSGATVAQCVRRSVMRT